MLATLWKTTAVCEDWSAEEIPEEDQELKKIRD